MVVWGSAILRLDGAGANRMPCPNGIKRHFVAEQQLASKLQLASLEAIRGFVRLLWRCKNEIRNPV